MQRSLATLLLASTILFAGAVNAQPVDIIAKLDERPGNPAVTADGRIIFSQQPLDKHTFAVVELKPEGRVVPFPNAEWAQDRLAAVIGVKASGGDLVWMLDMGAEGREPKLVAWNTKTDKLARDIPIPASARLANSFLQDFAVDQRRNQIVIADMTAGNLSGETRPAFIVVDIETGRARRVLEGHASLQPNGAAVTVDGKSLATKRANGSIDLIQFGLNPITIDPAGEWIYYGTINGRDLWRISAAALADASLMNSDLAGRIERYADKSPSDGIVVDAGGQVYVTDVENNAIGVATPKGYRIIVKDDIHLSWPDGMALGPNGALYVTVNQLHRHPAVNRGFEAGKPPYFLVKLRPEALKDAMR